MLKSLVTRPLVASTLLAALTIAADAMAFQSGQGTPPPQQGREGGQRQRGGTGQGQGGGTPFNFGGGGGRQRGGMMGAFAQFQSRYKPEFLRRDIPLYKDQLGFDAAQMTVVEALVNDYDLSFNPAAEESQEKVREAGQRLFQAFVGGDIRERMREARDSMRQDLEQLEVENGGPLSDEARRKFMTERTTKLTEEAGAAFRASGASKETKAILQEIFDEVTRWDAKRAELRKPVADGLEASLTPEQKSKWPAFQRFVRREKSLENASLSGEGVNLFVVMDEAGLSQASIDGAARTLDEYEVALDQALVARDDYLTQSEPKLMKSIINGDSQGAKVILERQIALRRGVRDVNDQYRVSLLGVLPADEGAKFNTAAMTAAFTRVFRATRTSDAFAKALELPDLAPESRDLVLGLQTAYVAELASMNDRIATLTRKEEPQQRLEESLRILAILDGTESPMSMMGRGFGGGGGAGADPVGDLMDQRGDMGTRYLDQLHGLLTPAQQDQLPKGRDGGRSFGGFGTGKISDLPAQMQDTAKAADKNKDGTIDDAERAGFFDQMRQSGGGGQGGGQGRN